MSDTKTSPTTEECLVNVALWWVVVFGLWPLADPGHDGKSMLSVADLVLHFAACAVLYVRWRAGRV